MWGWVSLNSLKVGTILIVIGCFLCVVNTTIGVIVIACGALAIIGLDDKPEKPAAKDQVTEEEPRVKIVGNQALLLDKDGFVIGASALPDTDKKQLR